MGLRSYLLKRTINTIILVVFVIVLNFIIFTVLPGSAGSIELIASNPHLNPQQRQILLQKEELRYGLICGVDSTGATIPCPVWVKFEKYFVQMVTFQFGNSYKTGNPVVTDIISSGRLANLVPSTVLVSQRSR